MTFDYDKKNVVFYSNKRLDKVDFDTLFPTKKLIKWAVTIGLIILIILLLKVIQIIMTKTKINKHQKAIEDVYQLL